MERKNKLGMRPRYAGDYETEHPRDIDQVLEFSNCLREIAGLDTKIKNPELQRNELILKFIKDFEYLNNAEEKNLFINIVKDMIGKTASEHMATQLPANNALLLVFRFLDALNLAIKNFEKQEAKPALFPGDNIKHEKQNHEIYDKLVGLNKNISEVLAKAFEQLNQSPEEFLGKFSEHKLWQNSLTQKDRILASINA